MRLPVGQAGQLGGAEAIQKGKVALCILVVNLDHAANEELLLLSCPGLPVVGLQDGDGEALFAGPLAVLSLKLGAGHGVDVVIDGGEVFHGPRLANGESAIGIFTGLVQLDSARAAHRDDDDACLLA